MRQLQHIIRLVAGRRATVLITGETGTGKELGARALHMAGNRRSGPMVAVNCSALPESSAGERTVRTRARRIHGRVPEPHGPLRAGPGGHSLSGRNRRTAHGSPDQTAARAAGARGAAVGQFGNHQGGHTGGSGHQLRSGAADRGRQVPRGSLLPSECGADRDAAFAQAARRCAAVGEALRGSGLPARRGFR